MNKKKAAKVMAVVLIVGWIGYSFYVFNLENFSSKQRTVVMASDTVSGGENMSVHVTVDNRATNKPLKNTKVEVYLVKKSEKERKAKKIKVTEGKVGKDGSISPNFRAPNEKGVYKLLVEADSKIGEDKVKTELEVTNDAPILIDTDKPVYQPGQTVHIRGLVKKKGKIREIPRVIVKGPSGNRLFSRDLNVNEYRMGELDFPISSEAPEGNYRVIMKYGKAKSVKKIEVKQYTLPRFDVGFRPDKKYYKPGEKVSATIVSEYFFGKPVKNASVKVSGEGYIGGYKGFGKKMVETNSEGIATVEMALPEYFVGDESGKATAVFNITVTDKGGHKEKITRKVTVAEKDILIDAFTPRGKLVPDIKNTVYITTQYPDGRPVSAEVTINGEKQVETNRYGVAKYSFVPDENQNQEMRLKAVGGGEKETEEVHFKTGKKGRLALRLDKPVYEVGDKISGKAFVGKKTGRIYLDIIKDKQTVFTKTVEVKNGVANLSFDVLSSMEGDLKVRAWSVFSDNRVETAAQRVVVRQADKINVTVSPAKRTYSPGEEAMLRIETRKNGERVPAAVGFDIVDESVFSVEEKRPGLSEINYGIEKKLLKPRLFIHSSPRIFQQKSGEKDKKVAQEAAVASMSAKPHGTHVNSFREKLRHIEEKKEKQEEMNGVLMSVLLISLPFGAFVSGLRKHSRVIRYIVDIIASAGIMSISIVIGSLLILFPILIGFTLMEMGLSIVGIIVGLFILLVIAFYILKWGTTKPEVKEVSENRKEFKKEFKYLAIAYLGVGVVGIIFNTFIEYDVVLQNAIYIIPLSILFPLSYFGFAEKKAVKESNIKTVASVVLVISLILSPLGLTLMGSMVMQIGEEQESTDREYYGDNEEKKTGSGEVRQFFPETLASRTVVTGEDGIRKVRLKMADSITRWRISSLAATKSGELGTSKSWVRVFQPFFIKPEIPVSLTQKDEVTIPVSVYNYENSTKKVEVKLEGKEWYRIRGPKKKDVVVSPKSVSRVSFKLTAVKSGEHSLRITAVTENSSTSNTTRDAVRKEITVEPYGKRIVESSSGAVSGVSEATFSVPRDAVKNSSTTVLRLYPGTFGQVVGGIESLLEMPTGCFEQTSSSLYPDVLALRYMEATGKTNPEIKMTAEKFISKGYQRLLTFETPRDGGYSIFGRGPPDLLLTAYGLQEMSDMSKVYNVDRSVLKEMRSYIRSEQNSDGSWPAEDDLEYAFGVGETKVGVTAYISWSLAKSSPDSKAVSKGLDYVKENFRTEDVKTKTLAVALNALVEAERYPNMQDEIVDEIRERAITEDRKVYWKPEDSGSRYRDDTVLTTGLVVNGLVKKGYLPGMSGRAVKWITEQKNERGWGGTQNTVMALKALVNAQLNKRGSENIKKGEITVYRNGKEVAETEITQENSDEVQTIVLPKGEFGGNKLRIEGPKESGVYYKITKEYYVPWEGEKTDNKDEDSDIGMEVTYDRTNLTVDDETTVQVGITNTGDRVGMGLVSLGVPPGFSVDKQSLEDLVSEKISKYNVKGRQVLIYVEDIEGSRRFSFEIQANNPIEASTGPSKIHDYYNPERRSVEAPVTFHVEKTEKTTKQSNQTDTNTSTKNQSQKLESRKNYANKNRDPGMGAEGLAKKYEIVKSKLKMLEFFVARFEWGS